MNELTSGQREAELAADLAALRAELDKYHNQGRDRRRDESEQLTQLANHNQRLVEQLAEVSSRQPELCLNELLHQGKHCNYLPIDVVRINSIYYLCVRVGIFSHTVYGEYLSVVSQSHRKNADQQVCSHL